MSISPFCKRQLDFIYKSLQEKYCIRLAKCFNNQNCIFFRDDTFFERNNFFHTAHIMTLSVRTVKHHVMTKPAFLAFAYYLGRGRENDFVCCCLPVIMLFLFGEVSSSSVCLGWATLFYCGTPCAFHIIILQVEPRSLSES